MKTQKNANSPSSSSSAAAATTQKKPRASQPSKATRKSASTQSPPSQVVFVDETLSSSGAGVASSRGSRKKQRGTPAANALMVPSPSPHSHIEITEEPRSSSSPLSFTSVVTPSSNVARKKLSSSLASGGTNKRLLDCSSSPSQKTLSQLDSSKLSSRNWTFTVHDPAPDGSDHPCLWIPEKWVKSIVCQQEKGEKTGRVHYQGVINFNQVMTFDRLKRLAPPSAILPNPEFNASKRSSSKSNPPTVVQPGRVFWKICKGSFESNALYCSKPETRFVPYQADASADSSLFAAVPSRTAPSTAPSVPSGGSASSQKPPLSSLLTTGSYSSVNHQQGKRSDLARLKRYIDENPNCTIQEISENFFSSFLRYRNCIQSYMSFKCVKRHWKTEVTFCYGVPQTGKSRFCQMIASAYGTEPYYVKDGTRWFDNYDGRANIVFDDFYGAIGLHQMLTLLDRYPCQVENKGGYLNFAPKRIFITSNRWYLFWYSQSNSQMSPEAVRMRMQALYRRFDNILIFTADQRVAVYKGRVPSVEGFQLDYNDELDVRQQSDMIHPDARNAKAGQVVSLFRFPLIDQSRNPQSLTGEFGEHPLDADPTFDQSLMGSTVQDSDPFFMLHSDAFARLEQSPPSFQPLAGALQRSSDASLRAMRHEPDGFVAPDPDEIHYLSDDKSDAFSLLRTTERHMFRSPSVSPFRSPFSRIHRPSPSRFYSSGDEAGPASSGDDRLRTLCDTVDNIEDDDFLLETDEEGPSEHESDREFLDDDDSTEEVRKGLKRARSGASLYSRQCLEEDDENGMLQPVRAQRYSAPAQKRKTPPSSYSSSTASSRGYGAPSTNNNNNHSYGNSAFKPSPLSSSSPAQKRPLSSSSSRIHYSDDDDDNVDDLYDEPPSHEYEDEYSDGGGYSDEGTDRSPRRHSQREFYEQSFYNEEMEDEDEYEEEEEAPPPRHASRGRELSSSRAPTAPSSAPAKRRRLDDEDAAPRRRLSQRKPDREPKHDDHAFSSDEDSQFY